MLKLVFCLRRQAQLSREAFQRYWLESHAPLVRRHAQAMGLARYVQLHTGGDALNAALREGRGGPEPYDGVAELWWPDAETLARAMATPEGRCAGAALLEDERRFIDLEHSPLFVGTELSVVETAQYAGVAQRSGSPSGA